MNQDIVNITKALMKQNLPLIIPLLITKIENLTDVTVENYYYHYVQDCDSFRNLEIVRKEYTNGILLLVNSKIPLSSLYSYNQLDVIELETSCKLPLQL